VSGAKQVVIMITKSPLPVACVIKSEDKLEKVKSFIGAALAQITADRSNADARSMTMVARSPDSPVAKAVAAQSGALVAAGITVNVIFVTFDCDKSVADWRMFRDAPMCLDEMRQAQNPRLADAHEQLVLGTSVCWTGDCMRRDPSKRDAFEIYATGHAETVRLAKLSFTRLWSASEPVKLGATRPPARTTALTTPTDPATAAAALAAAMAGDAPHIVISTLH
jgi:hypothetical protein